MGVEVVEVVEVVVEIEVELVVVSSNVLKKDRALLYTHHNILTYILHVGKRKWK